MKAKEISLRIMNSINPHIVRVQYSADAPRAMNTAKVLIKDIAADVVTSIAKVPEKLTRHGSYDLSKPIAELANLAARVNGMSD